jgi:hypothetical protein
VGVVDDDTVESVDLEDVVGVGVDEVVVIGDLVVEEDVVSVEEVVGAGGAAVCEMVFAAREGLLIHSKPAGLSRPAPIGLSAISP